MSEHDAAGNAERPRAPGTAIAFGRRLAVELERTITAPMDAVWSVLRDYRARERLLGAEFADYVVRAGGVGEGTVIAYRLRIGRHERAYELAVEEPTPARQVRERDPHGALVITWTLTPAGDGERTLVRVEAVVRDPALDGRFARARARRALQRIHTRVLERLDAEFAAG